MEKFAIFEKYIIVIIIIIIIIIQHLWTRKINYFEARSSIRTTT